MYRMPDYHLSRKLRTVPVPFANARMFLKVRYLPHGYARTTSCIHLAYALHRTTMRFAVLGVLAACLALAQSTDVRLVRVATVPANPTEITFPGDGSGRVFVNQQQGRIFIIRNG